MGIQIIKIKNLPSEFEDFNASVCAAKALVRSKSNSWNCLESGPDDRSTVLKRLEDKNIWLGLLFYNINIFLLKCNIFGKQKIKSKSLS